MADEGNFVDYYGLIGVSHSAEVREIRGAFLQKAKQLHPDAGGSTQAMQQLNAAYKTLMDPQAKASYDLLHNFHNQATVVSDYTYHGGRSVEDVDDMTDDEIDSFLDSLFDEYRHGVPQAKLSVKQRIRKMLANIVQS